MVTGAGRRGAAPARTTSTIQREEFARAKPAFVGRDDTLSSVVGALCHPSLILIEGEAGIGKSRLVQEAITRRRCDRRTMPVAVCPPFQESLTLGPVIEALRRATDDISALRLSPLAGALRPVLPEWADVLPPALEPADDATAARHRLFRALAELFEGLGAQTLVVEDAHWADEVTLDFLLYLLARLPQAPNLLVTYQPDDLPPDSTVRRLSSRLPPEAQQLRIALAGLDVDQTARLVSSMLEDARVSGEFAEFLHARTEGVPLALEELVRLLQSRADIARRDGEWVRREIENIEVPPSIRDAVLERASRLSPDAQAMLRAAAVLIEPSGQNLLAAVAALSAERASDGLAEALGSGLLDQDEIRRASFRHVLNARAIYDSTPEPLRRSLHLRAASVLEERTPRPMARLALHFRDAGDTEKWLYYAEQAADLALSTGDETAAGNLLYEVLTEADAPAQTMVRLIDRLPVPAFAGRFEQLTDVLRTVLSSGLADPKAEAEVRCQLGRMLMLSQEYEEGRVELERAITGLGHDPVRASRAMLNLGWPQGPTVPADVHRRWLRRASEEASAMQPVDRLRVTVDRASALLSIGDPSGWEEAGRIPEEAAGTPEWQEIARGRVNVADRAVRWGRYHVAELWAQRAVDLCERRNYVFARELVSTTQLHLRFFTGEWDGLAHRAHTLAESELLTQVSRLEPVLVGGLLHAAKGSDVDAEQQLRLVVEEARDHGGIEEMMEPAAALGRLLLDRGDLAGAVSVTDEPTRIVAQKGIWLWATEVGPSRTAALVASGRDAEATELVAGFEEGLGDIDAPAPRCGLAMAKAILAEGMGDHPRAAAEYATAAAAWARLPRPYDALLAQERQAGCLLNAGERDKAVALLTAVLQDLARLGARAPAARVKETLQQYGVDVARPWRGGRKGYGDRLSPRELEVATLVIDGRTNRDIAEALFLSPKTVARHLNSAMRKLKVTTRTALAVRVVEDGLVDQPVTDTSRD